MSPNHAGMNSYHLRYVGGAVAGDYLYDWNGCGHGGDKQSAHSWLWTPESVDVEVAKESARLKWAVRAERAR